MSLTNVTFDLTISDLKFLTFKKIMSGLYCGSGLLLGRDIAWCRCPMS